MILFFFLICFFSSFCLSQLYRKNIQNVTNKNLLTDFTGGGGNDGDEVGCEVGGEVGHKILIYLKLQSGSYLNFGKKFK